MLAGALVTGRAIHAPQFLFCMAVKHNLFTLMGHKLCYLKIKFSANKGDEMARACNTHGIEEECIRGFSAKTKMKETTRKT
jgi:hypothetical protein